LYASIGSAYVVKYKQRGKNPFTAQWIIFN